MYCKFCRCILYVILFRDQLLAELGFWSFHEASDFYDVKIWLYSLFKIASNLQIPSDATVRIVVLLGSIKHTVFTEI